MEATNEQVEQFARTSELSIEMDFDIEDNRHWRKYNLWVDKDEKSDDWGNMYYNADERSMCGFIYEGGIVMFPEYYALTWGSSEDITDNRTVEPYFERLVKDALEVRISR